jgi:hypothetical protein
MKAQMKIRAAAFAYNNSETIRSSLGWHPHPGPCNRLAMDAGSTAAAVAHPLSNGVIVPCNRTNPGTGAARSAFLHMYLNTTMRFR